MAEKKQAPPPQPVPSGSGGGKAGLEIAGQRSRNITAEKPPAYLRVRVPQLTANVQTPACPRLTGSGDFPLARVR